MDLVIAVGQLNHITVSGRVSSRISDTLTMVERIIESKNHLLCERKVPNDVTTQCGDTYTWSWLPLTNVQSLLKN